MVTDGPERGLSPVDPPPLQDVCCATCQHEAWRHGRSVPNFRSGPCVVRTCECPAMIETQGQIPSQWQVMQARFLDQISDLYEHFDCEENCAHREGDRRAAAYTSQYLKEIVYEEGFRPEEPERTTS